MATLQKTISDKFLIKLAECKDVSAESIEQLRTLFAGGKKVKADDLAKIFSTPAGGGIK
jgi:hypothetical protein